MEGVGHIYNVIYDLGGVIADLDVATSVRKFAKLGFKTAGIDLEKLSRDGIPQDWELVKLMHAMDAGEIDEAGLLAALHPLCSPETTDEQILDAFNSIIVVKANRLEWIKKLKKTKRTYLLSNIGEVHWRETLRQIRELGYDINDCFDETFLSYQLRMTKPDPRIFAHVISQTGIKPEETAYLDDLPNNIEEGKKHGLCAVKIVTNHLEESVFYLNLR